MTTSAEERAEHVWEQLGDVHCSQDKIAVIAQAIRQAENDKLEEARQRVLEGHDEAWGNPAEQHGWDQAAQRIEALKKD